MAVALLNIIRGAAACLGAHLFLETHGAAEHTKRRAAIAVISAELPWIYPEIILDEPPIPQTAEQIHNGQEMFQFWTNTVHLLPKGMVHSSTQILQRQTVHISSSLLPEHLFLFQHLHTYFNPFAICFMFY